MKMTKRNFAKKQKANMLNVVIKTKHIINEINGENATACVLNDTNVDTVIGELLQEIFSRCIIKNSNY